MFILRSFIQDLQYGARTLGRNPGFTITAMITLALGIGANTAVFSVLRNVLWRPLGFTEPDRLVALYAANPEAGYSRMNISFPNFNDWREQNHSMVDMGIYTSANFNYTSGDRPERVTAALASASLFPVLGVNAEVGRVFGPEEDQPGRDSVVVLSHQFWQQQFAADANIVGREILLDKTSYTVVGVLPAVLANSWEGVDLWKPLTFDPGTHVRGNREFLAYGRLKPGVSVAQAQSDVRDIAARLAQRYPGPCGGHTVTIVPLDEALVGRSARSSLVLLVIAVGAVLLIACVNVANLMLARATGRQKDLAIRAALGASKSRLARQLVTECLILALAGGAVGVLLATWGVSIIPAALWARLTLTDPVAVDQPALWFTLLLSLATAVLFGLTPALRASSISVANMMKDTASSVFAGRSGRGRRDVIVVAQIMLAMALLTCAGVMVRSAVALRAVNPGLETSHVLTMQMNLPVATYPTDAQRAAFMRQAVQEIRGIAGVKSAAAVSDAPLTGSSRCAKVAIEDYLPPDDPGKRVLLGDTVVTAGYFKTMGIPLLSGRDFTEQDNANAPGVVIVNEHLATRYWPGESALGKRLKFGPRDSTEPWVTVVGVVRDVRRVRLNRPVRSECYLPYAQFPETDMTLVACTHGDPLAATDLVRGAIGTVDPDLAVYRVRSMEDIVAGNTGGLTSLAGLLLLFAIVAVALAAVGLYGVMSYATIRRTREIGLRVALGAQPSDVLGLIVGRAMRLTLLGIAGGLALSLVLGRTLQSVVYGVSPSDPLTLVGMGGVIFAVGTLAAYMPARRGTKVDPMVALRCE